MYEEGRETVWIETERPRWKRIGTGGTACSLDGEKGTMSAKSLRRISSRQMKLVQFFGSLDKWNHSSLLNVLVDYFTCKNKMWCTPSFRRFFTLKRKCNLWSGADQRVYSPEGGFNPSLGVPFPCWTCLLETGIHSTLCLHYISCTLLIHQQDAAWGEYSPSVRELSKFSFSGGPTTDTLSLIKPSYTPTVVMSLYKGNLMALIFN